MTCYFRHLQKVFKKAEIDVTTDNKGEVDKVIQGIVGVDYKDCSATRREVKKRIQENEEGFISTLEKHGTARRSLANPVKREN